MWRSTNVAAEAEADEGSELKVMIIHILRYELQWSVPGTRHSTARAGRAGWSVEVKEV